MAFQLTGFKAFGIRTDGSTRKHAMQGVILSIAATAADVVLDIGTDAGTFWTAVKADAKYGTMATQALVQLKLLLAQVNQLIEVEGSALVSRVPVGTLTAAGQYTMTISNKRPVLTLNAGDGDLAYQLYLRWDLKDNLEATVLDLGTVQ